MALKDLDQILHEIDAAVHTNGPLGKTTAPGLNAVLKSLATELITQQQEAAQATAHKADLDAGGRVPSIQLPSYVDDIVEVDSFAVLPNPGESGKIYVTLDTNKQYRWSGSSYAVLSDSGLTTDTKAALETAHAPGPDNPFATLADLPTDKDVKAVRIVAATRERVFYSGIGTEQEPGLDGLKKALAEAQPGDMVQQVTNAHLQGLPPGTLANNGEQVRIPESVNYDTNGFDINSLGVTDGVTFIAGKGVLHGRNATVYTSINGSWALGWYGGDHTLEYDIYDLHIHCESAYSGSYSNSAYLDNARIFHSGNVYNSSNLGFLIANQKGDARNQYEHVGRVIGAGSCQSFAIRVNGYFIQHGDVVVTEQSVAGALSTGARMEMHNGELDLRAAQAGAGFRLDATATLSLFDVTVLGDQMPALCLEADQAPGATVHLYGATTLPAGMAWPAGITVVDHRPASAPGDSAVGVEQDLGSNSSTKVPSVAAVKAAIADVPIVQLDQSMASNSTTHAPSVKAVSDAISLASAPILEFAFNSGYVDSFATTITAGQAGRYGSQLLSNVSAVVYKINNAAVTLPFTLGAGDTLSVSITRANAASGSALTIQP